MSDSGSRAAHTEPPVNTLPAWAQGPFGLWSSAAAVSLWLCALFVGWTLGGAVHLLLLVPLWIRPWRSR